MIHKIDPKFEASNDPFTTPIRLFPSLINSPHSCSEYSCFFQGMLIFTRRSVSSFSNRISRSSIFTWSGSISSFFPGIIICYPSNSPIIRTPCCRAGRSAGSTDFSFMILWSLDEFASATSWKWSAVASEFFQFYWRSTSSNTKVISQFLLTHTSWWSGTGTRSLQLFESTQCFWMMMVATQSKLLHRETTI